MSKWRDMSRIPKGMSDFHRWYRPEIDSIISPSDVDGILHTKNGNRFLMFEFKPEGATLTTGQRITLQGFSRLPGCTSIVVFDPFWDDTSREPYDDDLTVKILIYEHGQPKTLRRTIRQLNQSIEKWFHSKAR